MSMTDTSISRPRQTASSLAPTAYMQAVEEVAVAFGTDTQRGLSDAAAHARLKQYGPNELVAEQPVPAWRRFFAQFRDVLVVLLLIATVVSGWLWFVERDAALPYEAFVILAVVLLNATMGFIQESRAQEAVAALRAMSAADATVIRSGERHRIPAAEIVPGDLILIEEGDTIPADARLVESASLQTAEAALTGESHPVDKDIAPIGEQSSLGDRRSMVFSGTAATYGHGAAIVTATGMHTEMGRIAGLLKETHEAPTPLQRELDRTGKILGLVVLMIAVVMIVTILLVQDVRGAATFADALVLGVALAVAAVPEGLPAVVTAVLSIGMQRMARRNALVRHLAAVETLGSASVIASDKTGTLTKNEMTVRVIVTASGRVTLGGSGYAPEGEVRREDGNAIDAPLRSELQRAFAAANRANNAIVQDENGRWTVEGDPTEGALIVAARKAGLHDDVLDVQLPRVAELPFSSKRKLMSTVHRDRATRRLIVFTKGAPAVLLARCTHELVGEEHRPLTPERRAEILHLTEELAGEALRTLGVAGRWLPGEDLPVKEDGDVNLRVEQSLVFAGLIGMIDPPRAEARDAVTRAKHAGIRPLMITGDHPRTASVIARELGIASNDAVITGAELDRMTDDELGQRVGEVSVYARVNPEHKLRLVSALQRTGAVVAMTGDGVNDAPALKSADIGIAMGITGTDVSKQAADIVLADDNFASIVTAVEEGRAIFANIRKFLRFLLSSNIGEVLTMVGGVLFADRLGLPSRDGGIALPLLATQLLWINLVTDGAPAMALGVDPADEDVMQQPPRPEGERVIPARTWAGIAAMSVIMAAGTLFVLDATLPGGFVHGSSDLRHAQTMAFTTLTFFQLFNVINSRSEERSAFRALFTNRWLWGAIGLAVALQALVLYTPPLQRAFGTVPLGTGEWIFCVTVASSVLWFGEAIKLFRHESNRPSGSRSRTGSTCSGR